MRKMLFVNLMNMKKQVLFLSFLCSANILFAQLTVHDNGNVMIGDYTGTILSRFAVGGLGDASAIVSLGGSNTHALKISNGGTGAKYGLTSTATTCNGGPSNTVAVGVVGQAQYNASSSTWNCSGVGVGVRGMAGISGGSTYVPRAYGVSGVIFGNGGAGVFGGFGNTESVFTGKYSAYFDGDAIVTNGTLTATVVAPSDNRLKTNVSGIDYRKTMANIMQLKPVEYNLKQILIELDSISESGDTVNYYTNTYDESTPFFNNKHYGLIAQELQQLYPDLVYSGSDGYLRVDYVSLIPILLTVVQQQQKDIEQLKQAINLYLQVTAVTEK